VEVDYPEMPLPRQGDELLIDIFQRARISESTLRSLNRCRIVWHLLFLSDMVAANGRQIELKFLSPPTDLAPVESELSFAEERPTPEDWAEWAAFWGRFTFPGLYLESPLGKWVEPTHRKWDWAYDAANDIVEHRTPDGVDYYSRAGGGRTRSERIYVQMASYDDGRALAGVPCTVKALDSNSIRFHSFGPSLATSPAKPDDFLSFLTEWGGEWMWRNVQNEGRNLKWVVEAMQNGTAIWVTDGSYNREIAPKVSGAGWLVYCTRRQRKLFGSFFEFSANAGSYRGELLGLLAIHTLIAAIEAYYSLGETKGKLCCDNQGALHKSKERRRRIPVGASQADIKRAFRNVKHGMHAKLDYEWVESHQDRYKMWWQLSTEQQLNCICDELAKEAVRQSFGFSVRTAPQLRLPRESAAVFVAGMKQTTDVAQDVRFELSRVAAERFYTAPLGGRRPDGSRRPGGLGWSLESFQAVDWAMLDATLAKKPQMYKQWLAKQGSGFCGTQQMVAHWDSSRDGRCPNCQRPEPASHLNLCPDADRTRLLRDMANQLGSWLEKNYAHPELLEWLPRYITLRGTRQFSDFPHLSPEMRRVAASQDLIPWTSFMEGKLSKEIFRLQGSQLMSSPSRLTIVDWGKQLISQILQISHAQWVFRNVSLYDAHNGYLRVKQRRAVLREVDRLSQVDTRTLPDRSRYLLEIDFSSFSAQPLAKQQYWVYAMQAAIKAGKRAATRQRVATARDRRVARVGAERRRRQRRVAGASDAWDTVREEHGLQERPSRVRRAEEGVQRDASSVAGVSLSHDDNKRRRPD